MKCPRCGTDFDVSEARSSFDHYFSGSAEWKYDDLYAEPLCRECAENDAEDRWMDGTLKAADGDPSVEDQEEWRRLQG